MEFQSKVVIITGAAGGIGKVTAELFAKKGTLVLVDLNKIINMLSARCNGGIELCHHVSDEQQSKT